MVSSDDRQASLWDAARAVTSKKKDARYLQCSPIGETVELSEPFSNLLATTDGCSEAKRTEHKVCRLDGGAPE